MNGGNDIFMLLVMYLEQQFMVLVTVFIEIKNHSTERGGEGWGLFGTEALCVQPQKPKMQIYFLFRLYGCMFTVLFNLTMCFITIENKNDANNAFVDMK